MEDCHTVARRQIEWLRRSGAVENHREVAGRAFRDDQTGGPMMDGCYGENAISEK
jgi:hypothetical protein